MSEKLENLLLEADGLFDCRRLDEAQEKYEEVLKQQPSQRQALNRLARLHATRGRIRELVRTCFRWQESLEERECWGLAGAVAESILRFDPHSLEGRQSMLRHLEKAADQETYVAAARRDARFFVEMGNGDLSIQVLERALETCPGHIDLSMDLADMHVAQGHLQEAVLQFRALASRFEAEDQRLRAADVYRRLKVLLPESPDVLMRLGHIYLDHERFDEAISEFRSVLRVNLTHRDALMGLGEASIWKGSLRDAILAFRKVVALDPRDFEARDRLADCYIDQGLIQDAVKELLSAALLCAEIQELEKARALYTRILEVDPGNPTAVREQSNLAAALAEQETARRRETAGIGDSSAPMPFVEPVAAVSEDDLYAGPATLEEDLYAPPLTLAEEPLPLDEEALPPAEEPLPALAELEGAPAEAPRNGRRGPATRVLPSLQAPNGALWAPVPFVVLQSPGLLAAIREQVEAAPDPDVIPWDPLVDLDQERVRERLEAAPLAVPQPSQESSVSRPSGPVRSAFGSTGGFAQAFTSGGNASRGRRQGRWDYLLASGRPPRGDAPDPAEPDAHLSLADRIARRRRNGEVQDGAGPT